MESRSQLEKRARILASRARLLILYGPTGTGKTTLLQRIAQAWDKGPIAWIDAAEARVLQAPRKEPIQQVLDAGGSPLDIHDTAQETGATLTIIDHASHAPRYRIAPPDTRLGLLAADLEAASTSLARRLKRSHLIIATSEASIGSLIVRRRLAGGPTTHLYIPGIPWPEAQETYKQIAADCGEDPQKLHETTRGAPGLARTACEIGLEEWLDQQKTTIQATLVHAARQVERIASWKLEPRDLARLLPRLEEEPFEPLDKPLYYMVAEALTPYNITYIIPIISKVKIELHPPAHIINIT